MKKRAFTLVELLVVIAIIALLMALLMPALRLAKDQAAGLLCVHNLKVLSMAWFTYTVDNEGKLPGGHCVGNANFNNKSMFPDGFWVEPPQNATGGYTGGSPTLDDKLRGIRKGQLYYYVKDVDVYHCPFDPRIDMPGQEAFRSYSCAGGMNGERAYTGSGKTRPDRVAEVYDEIKSPALKYVFVEEGERRGWNIGSWIMNKTGDCWIDPLAPWHNERSTLGFADGHSEKIRWQDERTIEMNWNQNFNECHAGSPDLYYMQRGYVAGKNQ